MDMESHSATLPDFVPDADIMIIAQTNRMEWPYRQSYFGPGTTPWILTPADSRDGWALAPPFSGPGLWGQGIQGMPYGACIGYAEVESPKDVDTSSHLPVRYEARPSPGGFFLAVNSPF